MKNIMQCFYLILFCSLIGATNNKVSCQDSTTYYEIDIYNSVDSLLFESVNYYELDSLRLLADLELDENGYLTLPILFFSNRLNQAVYLILDEFVLIDDINYPNNDFTLSPFSAFIYMYIEKKEIKFTEDFEIPNKFPCYFKVDEDSKKMRWSFSIKFKKKKFREILKNKGESRGRIRAFYFLEEDIKNIESELGTTIRYSQIQSRHFYTKFILDLEDKHIHEFDLFDSNSENVDRIVLKNVFNKYIKPIKVDFKIYDLFK